MRKLIALVSFVALQVSPAMGHVGGPWSNNTHDSHTTGIFGGMITMKNGSGIFRFSQTDTAQLSAFSSSMIYYQGVTFLGSCQATIDWETKKIFGMTNGSAYNRSPRAFQSQAPPLNDNNPNFAPGTGTQNRNFTIPLTPIVSGDGTVTERTFQFTNVGFSGPVGIANSHWRGKLTKTAPNIRFEAKGEASFMGQQPIVFRIDVAESAPTTVPNPAPGGGQITLPGTLEGVTIDAGGNDAFPKPRNQQKIRVFGSRIAYNASPSIGGQAGGLDGTGGGAFAF